MAETCPRCGRTRGYLLTDCARDMEDVYRALAEADCDRIAAAYRRGIDRGVELAKEWISWRPSGYAGAVPVWTNVDEAAKAAKGEA